MIFLNGSSRRAGWMKRCACSLSSERFSAAIVAFINESVTPLLFAVGCFCLSEGLSSPNLESEIKQIWGLQEVSSECDLPDHDLPTKNMKCYVTNGKGHKELVEIRVSKDGTKLGLYDTDGKALKTTGKE